MKEENRSITGIDDTEDLFNGSPSTGPETTSASGTLSGDTAFIESVLPRFPSPDKATPGTL